MTTTTTPTPDWAQVLAKLDDLQTSVDELAADLHNGLSKADVHDALHF